MDNERERVHEDAGSRARISPPLTGKAQAEADSHRDSWVETVGFCYTAHSIRRKLGMTAKELEDATRDLRILALETDDGVTLYPMWQVREGEVIKGLHEILAILRTGADDPWTWAKWLVFTPPPDDVNRSPIDELRGGRTSQVIRDAEHVAHAWAQ